ncbi:unnamed protein product [Linum trigynum]|uniref:Uncharacterized protein n=1 Tax=Linum trigynum TaxID=586398 RepID=A0AAV2CVW5_9ROSI
MKEEVDTSASIASMANRKPEKKVSTGELGLPLVRLVGAPPPKTVASEKELTAEGTKREGSSSPFPSPRSCPRFGELDGTQGLGCPSPPLGPVAQTTPRDSIMSTRDVGGKLGEVSSGREG